MEKEMRAQQKIQNDRLKKEKETQSFRSERGQALVEFALLLPVMILFLMLPFEYYRYIRTKMTLDSAACSSLAELDYGSVESSVTSAHIIGIIGRLYGGALKPADVAVDQLSVGGKSKEEYTYYVYSSDKADNDFADQFDRRDSNYQCREVKIRLSYQMRPVTLLGRMFLGDSYTIKTREYSRVVYSGGYEP